jgi:outer membrane protein assembly factor BamB
MMKKKYKIFLVLFILIIVVAGLYAYSIFKTVLGNEKITGTRGNIPEKVKELPPLTTDSSDWPNWRGKQFDGKSSFKGIIINWSAGLQKIWEVDYLCQDQATATWSAPVIQGNRLIVPGRDENNDLIFCLNPENGQLIWKGSYPASAGTSHGPGPRATPFIDKDRVYTYGRSGDLVCWDLLDGTKRWHINVKSEGGQEPD